MSMACATVDGAARLPMFPLATVDWAAETDVSPKLAASNADSTPVLSRFKNLSPIDGIG
jgi:hypothetical protein